MLKFITILFFLIRSGQLYAQDNLLVNFSAQQIENYIHLSFTVRGGVTCLGTEVHRAEDSLHFTSIGTIPGVCGNSITDETYTFDDVLPLKNKNNFYRISFGPLGTSAAIKIGFTDYGDGFVIAPNPAIGSQTIFFSNFNHQELTFTLLSLSGEILQSVETNGDKIILSAALLPTGIYFLRVHNTKEVLFTGKILFQ